MTRLRPATPFTPDGAVDHESLANLVNGQLANGTHGLSIGGSTGEPSALSLEERIASIRTVIDAAGGRVPVVPGTGSDLPILAYNAPAAHARMFQRWEAGDHAAAREIHYGLHPLVDVIFTETDPAAGKWVLERMGIFRSGSVRPPLIPLTETGRAAVEKHLSAGAAYLTPAGGFTIGGK